MDALLHLLNRHVEQVANLFGRLPIWAPPNGRKCLLLDFGELDLDEREALQRLRNFYPYRETRGNRSSAQYADVIIDQKRYLLTDRLEEFVLGGQTRWMYLVYIRCG